MKYTIEQITEGEDEVILKYLNMSPEVEKIYNFISGEKLKLIGQKEDRKVVLEKRLILYIESVDGKTFAYTEEEVFKIDYTLTQLSQILNDINFFRCSKSMILNIDRVKSLKSLASNRIEATMCNGEHIMISRTYAADFRKILKGGSKYE